MTIENFCVSCNFLSYVQKCFAPKLHKQKWQKANAVQDLNNLMALKND